MARKGSKYAKKHLIFAEELEAKQTTGTSNISSDDQKILEILNEPYLFRTHFPKLNYEQQISMIVTLYAIDQEHKRGRIQNQEIADTARALLAKVHKLMDTTVDVDVYQPISKDEKRLVRMDCYGKIDKRASHELSTMYSYFRRSENLKPFKRKEYDMASSPSWKVFRQFESFRSIEDKVLDYLVDSKINPDALKVMTVTDYCDVIYKAFATQDEGSASFIEYENSVRARFMKEFMDNKGEEFANRLLAKGRDPRAVASLCNALRHGHSDVDTLAITETHYTKRILTDLARAKYDVSGINEGDRIDPEFINELFAVGQENLVLAREMNGDLLSKRGLPNLQVHHQGAVQFAAHNGYLARTNYPNNLVLVESLMHARYYHLFDEVSHQDQMTNIYSRLNLNTPNLAVVMSFNPKDSMCFDFEQSPEFLKRQEEDKRYVVNYIKVMEERVRNEVDIANKYGLPTYNLSTLQSTNILRNINLRVDMTKPKGKSVKKQAKLLQQKKAREAKGK